MIGNNFFTVDDKSLKELPQDVLINIILKLKQDNKTLKQKIRELESVIENEFMTHGR